MSASEYTDIFWDCQNNGGRYRMFAIDIINSRNIPPSKLERFHSLFADFACQLKNAYPEAFIRPESKYNLSGWDKQLVKSDFLQLGDAYGVYWDKGCIQKDEYVIKMFSDIVVVSSGLTMRYGFADFDTCLYAEGADKLYGAYCFTLMTEKFKEELLRFRT